MTPPGLFRVSCQALPCIRHGSTMVELMVTLALLSIVSAVATLALRGAAPRPREETWSAVMHARGRALREGRAVTIGVRTGGRVVVATALPDGTVVADSALHVDVLTGQRRDTSLGQEEARAP